ncbi:hypothetical protein JTB14_000817 [Gonioctena quinquepunctata]|nr:hypothetical protein JTB14_000817 [Gonioctena quinquepunctata]
MITKINLLLLLVVIVQATGAFSPFDFVDNYVQNFQNELDQLTRWSDEYKFQQENYEGLLHNESLAFIEAEEYDFIIVGGGASGAALANRLSEEPKWRILLLEAGGPETTVTQVPSMHPHLLTSPYTWGYTTVPQKSACLGMVDGKCTITKGKALGGDSSINDMLYTRGHPRDYDIWSDDGLMGWCWTSVFPYFKKAENALVEAMDKKYRHYGGPVHIENFPHLDPLFAEHLFLAGRELGLETGIDYNGKQNPLGLGLPQVITKDGKRHSAAQAYLDCSRERENLVVIPHSHVIEVIVSHHTKEASGVKYIHEGELFIAKAKKEVILAAGAINTPQLLMLSGIGPKNDLLHLGIPVAADICVGCYLKDHVSFMGLNFVFDPLHEHEVPCSVPPLHQEVTHGINTIPHGLPFNDPSPITDPLRTHDLELPIHKLTRDLHLKPVHEPSQDHIHNPILEPIHKPIQKPHLVHSMEELVGYLKHGTGPLSTTGVEMVGFVKTEHSRERTLYPDIQLLIKKIRPDRGCDHLRGINIKRDIHDHLCKPLTGPHGFHIEVILLHPKSVGTLKLVDKDPFHHPWINPNALCDSDEEDVETLLAGIHKAIKLAQSPSMERLGVKLVHERLPECDQGHLDDEYWRCAIKYLSVTKGNVIGTAKMAPITVKGGVVDQELRVYGVHKLRVADASVIPITISGSTMAPELMIGEHAADLIKKDVGQNPGSYSEYKMNTLLAFLFLCQALLETHGFGLVSNSAKQRGSFQGYQQSNRRQSNNSYSEEYDFIIVGSGSAGAVIANRLSENPEWKILLLEAGQRANAFTDIPLFAPIFQLTRFNWGYNMEKQEGICNAMEDGICSWPRGRALGGSSVINYMIYTRGNPIDYEKWKSKGNPGWSYDEVLPYYLKSEDCHLGEICNSPYHKEGGYLSVDYPYATDLTNVFMRAGTELGQKLVDYNTPDFMGFSQIQANQKFGRRHSVAAAFLDPIRGRPNLQIETSARVTNILIRPDTKEAYGVEFYKGKQKYTVSAKKEVILSAGVFHSPQLLMLSGIGPKDHLKELGTSKRIYRRNPAKSIRTLLTSIGSLQFDLDIFSRPGLRVKKEIYKQYFQSLKEKPCYAILPMLLHPESKGYLKLRSTNPFDAPLLYGNFLTDPENHDLKTLISAVRYIQKISETEAFRRVGAKQYEKPIPGCENHLFDTDHYWECALRSLSVTLHHQISTCKMGPKGDPEAVVDNRLRVHGVKNLRIADTSVIPVTLSAHTNAPAIMIGEKLADILKEDWNS